MSDLQKQAQSLLQMTFDAAVEALNRIHEDEREALIQTMWDIYHTSK